jgi:hypothetical protein
VPAINLTGPETDLLMTYGEGRGPITVQFTYNLPAAESISAALVQSSGAEIALAVDRVSDTELTIEVTAEQTQSAERAGSWYLALDYGAGRVRMPLRGPYRIVRAGGGGQR